jgi:hypothetical protein
MEESHCGSKTQRDNGIDTLGDQYTLRHFGGKDKESHEAQKGDHGKNGIDYKESIEKVANNFARNLLRPLRFHF